MQTKIQATNSKPTPTAKPKPIQSKTKKVCELIWVTVDPATCAPNPAMAPLATDLVRGAMELRPRFTTALRVAQAEEGGRAPPEDDVDDEFDDDFDAIKGMGRLFCEVGLWWLVVAGWAFVGSGCEWGVAGALRGAVVQHDNNHKKSSEFKRD